MKATAWGLCATALLTAGLVGCPGMDFFSQKPQQPVYGEEHLLDGSLQAVVDRTQGVLRELGIQVETTPEDEAIRLKCTTPLGSHFGLVLSRSTTNEAFTVLGVEWQEEEEAGLTRMILARLTQSGLKVLITG